jgi:hypothetical protein
MSIAIVDRSAVLVAGVLILASVCGQAKADGACDFGNLAPTEKLYQLHKDGSIFVKNDKACTSPACFGGWFLLDNNPNTVSIAAYCDLYQMHSNGAIFHYTGNGTAQDQCTIGGFCGHWEPQDLNPQTKAIAVGAPPLGGPPVLFQMHGNGSIFRRNGKPCKEAQCFGGWDAIDLNPATVAIAAGTKGLYQLHSDGTIFRWDGRTTCDGRGCVGWTLLDQSVNVSITVGHGLYRKDKDGGIFHYVGGDEPCTTSPCPGWQKIGQDTETMAIKSGNPSLFRLRHDGKVLQQPNNSCPSGPNCFDGWILLDQHPDTVAITAGRQLYQMRRDGSIFHFNGRPCGTTPGCSEAWDQLDANPNTAGIVVNGNLSR